MKVDKSTPKRYKPTTLKKNGDVLDFINSFENKMKFDSDYGLEGLEKKVKEIKISSKNERSRGILKKTLDTKKKLTVLLNGNKNSLLVLEKQKKTIADANKKILSVLNELEKLEEKNKLQ